jgi:hypothetical protein
MVVRKKEIMLSPNTLAILNMPSSLPTNTISGKQKSSDKERSNSVETQIV